MPAETELKALLRDLLGRTGLNQGQYAKRIGLNPTQMSRLMNLVRVPQPGFLSTLLDVAGQGPNGPVPSHLRSRADELLLQLVAERHPTRRFPQERLRRERDESAAQVGNLQHLADEQDRALTEGQQREQRLAVELAEATRELQIARQESADRQERVRTLEQRLIAMAKETPDGIDQSLPALQIDLEIRWKLGRDHEADRLLMAAAHNLPSDSIVALWQWLLSHERLREARCLVSDAARSRHIGTLGALAHVFSEADLDRPSSRDHVACQFLRYIGEYRSLDDVLELHALWRDNPGALRVRGWDDMVGAWMHGLRTAEERARLFTILAQDPVTNADAWSNAAKEIKHVDDVAAAELLLLLAGRNDSPWVQDAVAAYFDRDNLVVSAAFWRSVQDNPDRHAQDVILREAAKGLVDNILPMAAEDLWEQAEARGSYEFLERFLDNVVKVGTGKAQRLLEVLKNRTYAHTYMYRQQRDDTVQMLDALLYKRLNRDVTTSRDD